jgi:hypothetical protein
VSPVKYELGFYIPEDGILDDNELLNCMKYSEYLESSQLGPECVRWIRET